MRKIILLLIVIILSWVEIFAQPMLDCPVVYRRIQADEQQALNTGYHRISSGTLNGILSGGESWEIPFADTAAKYRAVFAFSTPFTFPYTFTVRQGESVIFTRTSSQAFVDFVFFATKPKVPLYVQLQFLDAFSLQNTCGVYSFQSTTIPQQDTILYNTDKDLKGYKAIFRAGIAFPPMLQASVELPMKNSNWAFIPKLTYSPQIQLGRNANADFLQTPNTLRFQAEARYYRNLERRRRSNKDIRANSGTYVSLSYEQMMRFERQPRSQVLPFGAWFYLPDIEFSDNRNLGKTNLGFLQLLFGTQRNLPNLTDGCLGYINAYGGLGFQFLPIQRVGVRIGLELGLSKRVFR